LIVTKRITWVEGRIDQKYYAAALQLPALAAVRVAKGKREQLAAWNQLVDDGALTNASKAKPGQDLDALMTEYETAHQEQLEPIEREEQFFGPRNIGGGKLDNYTRFVYLPAVRDVADDTSDVKNGTLNQLLDMLVMRQLQSRPDVQQLKMEFSQRVKDVYDPAKLADLAALSTAITATLSDLVPGAAFHLSFGDVKMPEIPTPPAIPTVTEDSFAGDITRKGHGLQRAVIFTLLQHLAVLQRGEASPAIPSTSMSAAAATSSVGPDLILAIEEPELYQHPQRCRYLLGLLGELAETPGRGLGARNQVLYTTHSSYFVSLDRFSNIRRVLKSTGTPEEPGTTTLASFRLATAAQQMAAITDGKPEEFTADSFRARAYPVMTPIVNEGFFANAVVVVEGMCEAGAL
jgi:putative ATP-dependent endonuclease of the OLD family